MNVNDLMSREPRSVQVSAHLDAAARVLWDLDCGIVPVVDAANVVVGVLTDRDLCMAALTQGRLLTEIPVAAAMAKSIKTCRPDESLTQALATMQQLQVRRLPVVDARGVLVGVLSTNDVVRAAHARPAAVDASTVVRALATIGAPRRATTAPAATSASAKSGPAPAPQAANATAVVLPAPTAEKPVVDAKAKGKPKNKKG